MADAKQNIIIKKVKKVSGGHHGGAWKVAYADFVTAMMAFFLLMWLLNVTTDVQRQGIADYFSPASISSSDSGAGGMFGGRTVNAPEAKFSDSAPPSISQNDVPPEASADEESTADNKAKANLQSKEADDSDVSDAEANELEKRKAAEEQKQFKAAEEALKVAISETPDLLPLSKSLIIDQTEEGLRIQIVDQENYSMFPSGGAQMFPQTRKLLELVGKAVSRLPNKLALTGHTDSAPFSNPNARDNWDLSAERANASRRVLLTSGVGPDRIQTVVGRADREPFVKENPSDPKNRRISIVLLRQSKAK